MTVPTKSILHEEVRGPNIRLNYDVPASGVTTFAGQFAALNTHAAAANQGLTIPLVPGVGQSFLGVYSDQAPDNGSDNNNIDGGGKIMKRVEVTGVVDAATDTGKAVWLADSGLPFNLTPAADPPYGVILKVTGTAEADVWVFGMEARWLLELLRQQGIDFSTALRIGI